MTFNLRAQGEKELELRRLKGLFEEAMSKDDFKDTNMVYMFAYKVEVKKSKAGNVEIKDINSSDSSSKLIYKNTDFIKKINFSILMGEKKHCTFVFPVVIFLGHYEGNHPGMIKISDVIKKFLPYLYLNGTGIEPTYDYIYIPALILLTSTASDV